MRGLRVGVRNILKDYLTQGQYSFCFARFLLSWNYAQRMPIAGGAAELGLMQESNKKLKKIIFGILTRGCD